MSNSSLVSYTKLSPNCNKPRNHKIDTITIHCAVGQLTVEALGGIFAPKSRQASSNYGIGADGRVALYVDEANRSWCSSSAANDHRAITIECACDPKPPYAINAKVYDSLVKLCADICKRNGIPELRWKADKSLIGKVDKQNLTVHRWFAATACPGEDIYNKLGNIAADVNKLLKPNQTPAPAPKPVVSTPAYSQVDFIKDVQRACGAKVDGSAGPETISKTVTLSATKNKNHKAVKPVQKRLNALGYTEVGAADGDAGPKFTAAVKHFQRDNGCTADGEITAKNKTWRKLLGMK